MQTSKGRIELTPPPFDPLGIRSACKSRRELIPCCLGIRLYCTRWPIAQLAFDFIINQKAIGRRLSWLPGNWNSDGPDWIYPKKVKWEPPKEAQQARRKRLLVSIGEYSIADAFLRHFALLLLWLSMLIPHVSLLKLKIGID